MAFTAYDTDTSTGDTDAEFAAATKDRTDALVNHHLSGSSPAGFTNGWLWFDSTTATFYGLKFGQNAGTAQLIGWDSSTSRHRVVANLDLDSNQLVNARFKNVATGSLTAAAAGVKGLVEFDTTLEKWALIGTSSQWYAAMALASATTYVRVPCDMNVGGIGTPATASTATEFGGWLMDATAEQLNVVSRQPVPNGWTGAHDLKLEIAFALNAAETNGDDADFEGTVRAITPGTDATNKTGTTIAPTAYDIGTASAQYSLHKMQLTIDFDDATNPVAVGDYVSVVVNRDTVGGAGKVDGTIVVACNLVVPVFNFDS